MKELEITDLSHFDDIILPMKIKDKVYRISHMPADFELKFAHHQKDVLTCLNDISKCNEKMQTTFRNLIKDLILGNYKDFDVKLVDDMALLPIITAIGAIYNYVTTRAEIFYENFQKTNPAIKAKKNKK